MRAKTFTPLSLGQREKKEFFFICDANSSLNSAMPKNLVSRNRTEAALRLKYRDLFFV
jgi:hypothetical protein